MKLGITYTGTVTAISYKRIPVVESDPKEYNRVAVIKVKVPYNFGDLDDLLPTNKLVADDNNYATATWGELSGGFILDVNDSDVTGKIIKIERTNKVQGEMFLDVSFQTAELDRVGVIGYYLKDVDNPAKIKMSVMDDA